MLANNRKIFCLGFQKTGTTSLEVALTRLGLRVAKGFQGSNELLMRRPPNPDAALWALMQEKMAQHDAIQDSPSPFFFEQFDKTYPGSKFILTHRPTEDWLNSYRRFFRNNNTPLRAWMYKVARFEGNEDKYRHIYDTQNAKIRSYFQARPDDFLDFNLQGGDGWHKLITFLGRDFLPELPTIQ